MDVKSAKTATDKDIRSILGPVEDTLITSIRKTGASRQDVLEACDWLDSDDARKQSRKPLAGKVLEVYELLQEDSDKLAEER